MPLPPSVEAPVPESAEDIVDLLSEDDGKEVAPKPPKEVLDTEDEDEKPSKKDTKDEEEEIELEEDDPEEDEEEEEKLDLKENKDIEIDAPPKKKELLKLYPDIFEKVPYLEKMIYRDRQYQEMFGSFDDAKISQEKAIALDELETKVLSGDTTEIFSRVKEQDPKAYGKVIDRLLPNLEKFDRPAYLGIVSDVAKRLIMHFDQVGSKTGNKELQETALAMANFIFPEGFEPPKENASAPEKDEQLENERRQFQQERLQAATQELETKVTNVLKNTITEYIDPRGEMSSFVKKNAIREAMEDLDRAIGSDSLFKRQLDRLWETATKNKFARNDMDKIRSIYLGKAKNLLPSAIKKARKEALKDSATPRKRVSEEQEERTSRRGPISTGRSAPNKSGKSEIKQGESVLDFLSRD